MKNISPRITAALAAVILATAVAPAMADVVGSAGWSRATPPGVKEAVGYLVLMNNGVEERKLLKITSPVSDEVTLHRSSITSEGLARMWPVGSLKIEPGESLRLEPGGLHVMFSKLKNVLKVGDKVPLTLQFDGFEKPFTVMLEVRPLVPETHAADHHSHAN
ncbi:MAG: copper chaperone PCu(A)C [Steroidobacteraceae bacterium]